MKFESRTFRFHGNALTYSDRRKGKVYCEVRRKGGDNYPIICDFCKYCSIGGKLKQNDGFKCRSYTNQATDTTEECPSINPNC